MKNSMLTLVIVVLAFVLITGGYSTSHDTYILAQGATATEETEQQQQQQKILRITRDATNSYTISSGASFIGSFETTYSILGSISSMNASKDLITSTIIEDFDSSPTIGYINDTATASSQESLSQPTLANPYASKEKINEKIKNELNGSIEKAERSMLAHGEIRCIFGMNLDNFKCHFNYF